MCVGGGGGDFRSEAGCGVGTYTAVLVDSTGRWDQCVCGGGGGGGDFRSEAGCGVGTYTAVLVDSTGRWVCVCVGGGGISVGGGGGRWEGTSGPRQVVV